MALATCTKDGTVSLNPMSFSDQQSNAVMERIRYQRASGRFCDVLIVVKDRKFNAHRMILAACSPYFDAILRHNKIIKEKVIVNCQNPLVFELLLNYIYSGNVVIDRSVVTELLKLANNLLIVKLKNYCAEYLERYIDVANCLSVRELAIKYNISELLKKSLQFFDSNINGCLLENLDLLNYNIYQLRELLNNPKYKETIRPDVHLNLIVRWVGHNLLERESLFKDLIKECPFQQVTTMRLERMLDYNPFFAQSKSSLYITLQEMHNVGMSMEKYEVQYRNLIKKFCQDKLPLHSLPNYYSDSNETTNVMDHSNDENFNIEKQKHAFITPNIAFCESFIGETSKSNFNSDLQTYLSTPPTLSNDREVVEVIAQGNVTQLEQARPSLKLRINLSGVSRTPGSGDSSNGLQSLDASHLAHKKRILFGMNHYRKKQKLMLKRRGRPPKANHLKATTDFSKADEEPESSFYEFDDEINTLTIFDEPNDFNPEIVIADTNELRLLQEHENFGSEIPKMQCESCLFKCQTIVQLQQHFAIVHAKNVNYVCNICQFECKWNRQFYEHMRQHFLGPPFQCDECPYSSERINVLLSHRLTHTNEKPFKCSDCEFRCQNKSNLVAHYRLHSGERPFKCQECQKSFAIRSTFEQHSAAHSDERPFVCDECDFATKYQSHLISHRRLHTGDLFRCEVEGCDYSSPKKSQLAAHLRTHLAVRSHQCRICNRSFIEKSHLVRHERIHLADKPFKCGSCDYASSRRDKLKEHILKHHNASANATVATSASSSDRMQIYRRKYRRARQIAQLTAQTKPTPLDSSELFRPISCEQILEDDQSQELQSFFQQDQQENLLHFTAQQQRRQRSGSESAMMISEGLPSLSHISSVPPNINVRNLFQQSQDQQQIVGQQQIVEQQQRSIGFANILQEEIELESSNNNVNNGNRPCSASLPTKDNYPKVSSLSPSCYSLHDFQHHHPHHLNHHLHQESLATPDTDLSTPGPHLESLRNPHSVSHIFESNNTERESGSSGSHQQNMFLTHQLSIDESRLHAAAPVSGSSTFLEAVGNESGAMGATTDDPVQRPMSLPNYGVMNQQNIPSQHYNLLGLDASVVLQAQEEQQQQSSLTQLQETWP